MVGDSLEVWNGSLLDLTDGTVQLGSNNAPAETSLLQVASDSYLGGNGVVVGNVEVIDGQLKPGLRPGPLRIDGNLVLSDAASLVVANKQSETYFTFHALEVSGNADLAGSVSLDLSNFALPRRGAYDFITVDGNMSGAFANVPVSGGPMGLTWQVAYEGNAVKLVADAITGDANSDGIVDQADFSIVESNLFSTGHWLDGDFNGDGLIDGRDYNMWFTHRGQQFPSFAVPEPSLGCPLTFLVFTVIGYARQRASW
jgi:hypothetical protein